MMKGLTILFVHLLKNDLSLQIRKNIIGTLEHYLK